MTSYEGFPGHEEIREEMDHCGTSDSSEDEIPELPEPMPRQVSTSSGENLPCAPPCSLSGSSENLTPNLDTTGKNQDIDKLSTITIIKSDLLYTFWQSVL